MATNSALAPLARVGIVQSCGEAPSTHVGPSTCEKEASDAPAGRLSVRCTFAASLGPMLATTTTNLMGLPEPTALSAVATNFWTYTSDTATAPRTVKEAVAYIAPLARVRLTRHVPRLLTRMPPSEPLLEVSVVG